MDNVSDQTVYFFPASIAAGHITAHKNIPHVTWMANSVELGNKTRFRTLVRTSGLLTKAGSVAVTLHKRLNWHLAGIISARKGKESHY